MKLIRDSLGVLADVLSILAFLGLTATGIVTWLRIGGDAAWILAMILFVLTFVAPVTAVLTIKHWGPKGEQLVVGQKFCSI